MKRKLLLTALLLAPVVFLATAQNYSVDWHKISSGGGTSAGGNFSVSGTIGQTDASANNALSGGNFSLTGGFWALTAIQSPGYPPLSIKLTAPNVAVVSWANTGSYTLQTNSTLSSTNWAGYSGSITSNNGTNTVTISPTVGNLFFRLK
jgi:hypothetical protein